jgi:uroporphyrinogen-III synthase
MRTVSQQLRHSPARQEDPARAAAVERHTHSALKRNMANGFDGLRVLALETRRASEIERAVRDLGGESLVVPAVREIRLEPQEHAFRFASGLLRGNYDVVVFLTDPGVRALMEQIRAQYPIEDFVAALRRTAIVSRGPKPAAALAEYKIPVTAIAPEPCTWREVMSALETRFGEQLRTMRVAVQEYAASNPEFLLTLAERTLSVTRVPLYEWALPEDVKPLRECVLGVARRYVDVVLFTTAVQVIHLFQVATAMGCADSLRAGLAACAILSIGPSTSEELRRHGLTPDFEPSHPRLATLVDEGAARAHELLDRKRHAQPLTADAHSLHIPPSRSTRANLPRTLDAGDLRIARAGDAGLSRGFEFLHEIGSRMAAADPFHAVLDRIVEFVSTIISCDSCFIYVLEQNQLVLRASRNPHEDLIDHLVLQLGQGITGWVAEHREPVAIASGTLRDPRFQTFRDLPEDLFEAMLAVPIQSAGKIVGVINLQHKRPYQHSPDQVRLLTTIGFLVGAEIERARLDLENLQLSERLETRRIVDRAKAVLQRDLGVTEQEAYHALQRESRDRRKSMREIADAILLSDDMKRKVQKQPVEARRAP